MSLSQSKADYDLDQSGGLMPVGFTSRFKKGNKKKEKSSKIFHSTDNSSINPSTRIR